MSRVAWTQLRPAEDAEAVREAIDRVLLRRYELTPLPTPTPATINAVSPTSVRN